nr:MAG TPA: hypothetical protein [Caudoviricetes sp.]
MMQNQQRKRLSRSGEAEYIKDRECERSTMVARGATNVTQRHSGGQKTPPTLARHRISIIKNI